jgi:hypothetical protein
MSLRATRHLELTTLIGADQRSDVPANWRTLVFIGTAACAAGNDNNLSASTYARFQPACADPTKQPCSNLFAMQQL